MGTPNRVVVRETRNAAAAALTNEQITRQRVDKLESDASGMRREMGQHDDYIRQLFYLWNTDFWGRMRWLLLGR